MKKIARKCTPITSVALLFIYHKNTKFLPHCIDKKNKKSDPCERYRLRLNLNELFYWFFKLSLRLAASHFPASMSYPDINWVPQEHLFKTCYQNWIKKAVMTPLCLCQTLLYMNRPVINALIA